MQSVKYERSGAVGHIVLCHPPHNFLNVEFYEQLPRLWPQVDARSWFAGNPALIADTAARNSSLQGAYLMLAARALGLDCGPMSGFDAEKVNAEFFPDGKWRANFLCNLRIWESRGPPPARTSS